MENREEVRHLTEEEREDYKQRLIDGIIDYFIEQKDREIKRKELEDGLKYTE